MQNKPIAAISNNPLASKRDVFLRGLSSEVASEVAKLMKIPSAPPRILSLRVKGDTLRMFTEIEAILGKNGFSSTHIQEAAIRVFYEKLKELGLIK